MSRIAKKPMFDLFNASVNGFGSHQSGDKKWQDYLPADKPLTLELGCAKARLSLELARRCPDRIFLGVDRKSDRLWRPAKAALEEGLDNIAFVQTDIRDLLRYIPAGSVQDIWITFPDPYPRKGDVKHRMTSDDFLALYRQLLVPGGRILFKTDDESLFDWSIKNMQKTMTLSNISYDLHAEDGYEDAKILTDYEERWHAIGRSTHYLEAVFKVSS